MRLIKPIIVLLLVITLAVCQSEESEYKAVDGVSLPQDRVISVVTVVSTMWPTAYGSETVTRSTGITASPAPVSTRTRIPTDNRSLTALPTQTALPANEPVATPSHPVQVDHYALTRPISRSGVDYVDRTYAYGDTQRGNRETHKGVEFVNPRGTPVLAAADGTVIFAGGDHEILVGPYPDYYGKVVVIEHRIDTVDDLPVYTVYGHLDTITVEFGQRVITGDHIGTVGAEGIAQGAHLHFEVRAGDALDFGATQNPDLWIYPYFRFGTLAGRVVNSEGELEYGIGIEIKALNEAGTVRYAFTYADDSVNPSASWNENFTMGDLPEGEYEILIGERGRVRYRGQITIEPDVTTWVDIVAE